MLVQYVDSVFLQEKITFSSENSDEILDHALQVMIQLCSEKKAAQLIGHIHVFIRTVSLDLFLE